VSGVAAGIIMVLCHAVPCGLWFLGQGLLLASCRAGIHAHMQCTDNSVDCVTFGATCCATAWGSFRTPYPLLLSHGFAWGLQNVVPPT
jgi:hypothetical protein